MFDVPTLIRGDIYLFRGQQLRFLNTTKSSEFLFCDSLNKRHLLGKESIKEIQTIRQLSEQ
ncbi:hypothetical protein FACHB389_30200 [Nostoc calcicola FACHB-389]|nr:hypothetical protein FACHB389_30200 [Nostoc calcicola FACHB-389]